MFGVLAFLCVRVFVCLCVGVFVRLCAFVCVFWQRSFRDWEGWLLTAKFSRLGEVVWRGHVFYTVFKPHVLQNFVSFWHRFGMICDVFGICLAPGV